MRKGQKARVYITGRRGRGPDLRIMAQEKKGLETALVGPLRPSEVTTDKSDHIVLKTSLGRIRLGGPLPAFGSTRR